jgi:hypothetical protein
VRARVPDNEIEMTLRSDPELYEPVSREDLYDLRAELAELSARVDALVEAVRVLGRDHYKPLPEGVLTRSLSRAEHRRISLPG